MAVSEMTGAVLSHVEATLRLPTRSIALILSLSHVVMTVAMRALLATYEPDPGGLRLDDPTEVFWWMTLTIPPLVIAAAAPSRISFALAVAAHAASPVSLVRVMQSPGEDLNFAIFVWWFYLPALMIIAFVAEAWLRDRRSAGMDTIE